MGMPVKQPESYMEPITTVELPDRSTEDLEESQMYQNLNSSNENLFNSQSIYMVNIYNRLLFPVKYIQLFI